MKSWPPTLPCKLIAALLLTATPMAFANERIRITSPWGESTAQLEDNPTTRALVQRLPLDLPMRDHLRQEKTGTLAAALPGHTRTLDFADGDLGLWSDTNVVIYYTAGSVPGPGIIRLGKLEGSSKIYDRPGPVTVRIERIR